MSSGHADPVAFQSLYRRYRPQRFSEVRGQDHVTTALRNAVRDSTVAHAYLFSGPRGTGKTSTARILAAALNCEHPVDGEPDTLCPPCRAVAGGASLDVVELDAASNRRIDDIRELLRGVSLATGGRRKVYILDEVHQLTPEASSALLKTLEEPPAHVVFVLATTDPQKVLPTIRSRTQHYDFHLLTTPVLTEYLRYVADDAGLDVSPAALDQAVRRGRGSARDALSVLDQIVAAGGSAVEDASVDDAVEALCDRDTARALAAAARAAAAGRDPRAVADALLTHLRDALLSVLAPEVVNLPDTARERVADQGRRLGPPAIVRALDSLGEAILAMREAPDPRVVLDVALVRMTRPELDPSPAALVERLERLERALRSGAVPESRPAVESPPADSALDREAPPPISPAGDARQAARRAVDAAATAPPPPRPARPAAPPPAPPAPAAPGPPAPAGADLPSRDELTLAWGDAVLKALRPKPRGLYNSSRFVERRHRRRPGLPERRPAGHGRAPPPRGGGRPRHPVRATGALAPGGRRRDWTAGAGGGGDRPDRPPRCPGRRPDRRGAADRGLPRRRGRRRPVNRLRPRTVRPACRR